MARPRSEKAWAVLKYVRQTGRATVHDVRVDCGLSWEDARQVVKRLVIAGELVREGETRLPHCDRPCGVYAPAQASMPALESRALSFSILTRFGAS